MRVTVVVGGTGGARFLRGLLRALGPDAAPGGGAGADVTAIVNTGDDLTVHGLRVCPDLDTVMYTLGGGIDEDRGWGRAAETFTTREELTAYDVPGTWFGLGDRDLATHLVRTQMLNAGYPLSAVTAALCARWQPGVLLLPMTDDRVETHIVIEQDGVRRAVHFQEWWVRLRAAQPALDVVGVGAETAKPGPGVLDAITNADVVLIAPSNPVVSVGPVLALPGVRDALAAVRVVGVSPVVGGAVLRGMADRLLPAVGVAVDAGAVGLHYGPELLDGWLVDVGDEAAVPAVEAGGIACRAVPLLMTDVDAAAAMARTALDLAGV